MTLVCHGMTEVVPDKDGSDPYEVSCQLLLSVFGRCARLPCVPERGSVPQRTLPEQLLGR